jgi:hypothetical protein
VIPGFRRDINEICGLLGYYAALIGISVVLVLDSKAKFSNFPTNQSAESQVCDKVLNFNV